MVKKLITTVCLFVASMCMMQNVTLAKNISIAFVNTQSIVIKWQKQIDDKLQLQFENQKNKIILLQNKIKNKIDTLNKEAAIMSPAVVNSTKKELDGMNLEYQNLATNFQKSYNEEGRRLLKDKMVYLEKAVNKVAKDERIDIVLQKNTALFVGNTKDITDKVNKFLKEKGQV